MLPSTRQNVVDDAPCRVCLLTSDSETVATGCVSETLTLLRRSSRVQASTVDAGALTEQALARFDVLLVTGGEPRRLRDRIAGRGANAIRAFVAGGGGYVGVCAGAVLATRKAPTLDLLPAVRCINDNVWWASGITGSAVLKRPLHAPPDPADALLSTAFVADADGAEHAYHNGPLLGIAKGKTGKKGKKGKRGGEEDARAAAVPLALFSGDIEPWAPDCDATMPPPRDQMDGAVAAVSGSYRRGRIVITSIHPEFLSDDGALLEAMCLRARAQT